MDLLKSAVSDHTNIIFISILLHLTFAANVRASHNCVRRQVTVSIHDNDGVYGNIQIKVRKEFNHDWLLIVTI